MGVTRGAHKARWMATRSWRLVRTLVIAGGILAVFMQAGPALAAANLVASASDDTAKPPEAGQDKQATPGRELDPRIVAQMPLSNASRQIQQLQREKGLLNFTGIRFDNDRGAVVLYWKGPLPAEMAALVEKLRANVPIDVIDGPYSRDELLREAKRLVELDLAAVGVDVIEAGSLPDFSGIRLVVGSAEEIEPARKGIQSPMRLEFEVGAGTKPLAYRSDSSGSWAKLSLGLGATVALAAGVWVLVARRRGRSVGGKS